MKKLNITDRLLVYLILVPTAVFVEVIGWVINKIRNIKH